MICIHWGVCGAQDGKRATMADRFYVYATFGQEKALVHSFPDLVDADRLRAQLNRRYAFNGMLAIATVLEHETTTSWRALKPRLVDGEQTREKQARYGVVVYGSNQKWRKRLHAAKLDYNPSTQTWFLGGLTYQQAKSLCGRMREAGVKVNLTGLSRQMDENRPYNPTAHDSVVAKQAESAGRLINRSLAGKKLRARHKLDDGRHSFETATAGLDKSNSTP